MASLDIEERVRNYLLQLSDEQLDSSELISNIIKEIDDWWETDDDNLSDIASRRRKIQAITNMVTSILFTHWKNADDSIYDAIQRAIEANLYNVIAQRQRKRKSVSAKNNAYFAEVVKKKLVTELPRTSSDSPVRRRPDDQRRDESDYTIRGEQESVLRANPSRPSVNPMAFEDPAILGNASLLLQPDILPNSAVNVPSLNISAIDGAQVIVPDFSIEEQMLNIPIPEAVNGRPEGLAVPRLIHDVPEIHDSSAVPNMRDDAAMDVLMATVADLIQPVLVPDLAQPDPVPDYVNQPAAVPMNIPPAEVIAAPLPTDEANATLPSSNALDLSPVRLSQIPPTRKQNPNKNLIIDRVTVINDYAARSIKLNKSQQVKQTDPQWCGLQKAKHAISVTRLFSSPAYAPMYNPVRGNKLQNLYDRHLIVNPCLVREVSPPTVNIVPSVSNLQRQPHLDIPIAGEQRSVTEEDPPIRMAKTGQSDQIVDLPVQNLPADISQPVTVIPPSPETTSPDEIIDRTAVSTGYIFPPVDGRRLSSDIFTEAADEIHHEIPAASDANNAHEIQTEISVVNYTQVRFPDETRAVISAAAEPSIPSAQTVHTEIPAANEVRIPDETRAETTATTEVSIPNAQFQTEIPAVNDVQPVETLDEARRDAGDDVAVESYTHFGNNEPVQIITVGERDLPQDRSREFRNSDLTDLLQERTLTPIENLMGGARSKRSKIALVRKLLKLNRQWLVRVVSINRQVFVTKFPEGMANTSTEWF